MIEEILHKEILSKKDIEAILSAGSAIDTNLIKQAANLMLAKHCGKSINVRALLEFSNICSCDCFYCGIRKSNRNVGRYELGKEAILRCARRCADAGIGSIMLQSGERRDRRFIDFIEDILREIKRQTKSDELPDGLGITLGVGEQSRETYQRFFEAGAHRYLLRIETSNPELFAKLHPPGQSFDSRLECLNMLRECGYQVGTGVMIGLPGQTIEDLAGDVVFFREYDIDMIGMGPYIVEENTPLGAHEPVWIEQKQNIFNLSLRMIAAVRLALRDVNIASTTALGTIDRNGKREGLKYGANVIMPLMTPAEFSPGYKLYRDKPESEILMGDFLNRHKRPAEIGGRRIDYPNWGDAPHFGRRNTDGKNT